MSGLGPSGGSPQLPVAADADVSLEPYPTRVLALDFSEAGAGPFGWNLFGQSNTRYDLKVGQIPDTGSGAVAIAPPDYSTTPQVFSVRVPALPDGFTVAFFGMFTDEFDGPADTGGFSISDFSVPHVLRIAGDGTHNVWTITEITDPDEFAPWRFIDQLYVDPANIPTRTGGVYTGSTDQEAINALAEAITDGQRHVKILDYDPLVGSEVLGFDAAPGLITDPVLDADQPFDIDGNRLAKGDLYVVATDRDDTDDGIDWLRIVDIDTGQHGKVPGSGASTPIAAGLWDNAISTNPLWWGAWAIGPNGSSAIFRPFRSSGADTWLRGGPLAPNDPTTYPYIGGKWTINRGGPRTYVVGGSGDLTLEVGRDGDLALDTSTATWWFKSGQNWLSTPD